MPKKKRPQRPSGVTAPGGAMLDTLEQAESLLDRKQPADALDLLKPLSARYPNRTDVLTVLAAAYLDLKDLSAYQQVCERLGRLRPNDPDTQLVVAGAYLMNGFIALGLQTLRRFLERWPDHEEVPTTRKMIADLEPELLEATAPAGVDGPEALALAAMHEEARSLVERGEYAQGRVVVERLLKRWPHFVPALNNLSQVYSQEGRLDQAVATARRVLSEEPDNYHALSNLTRFYCLQGDLPAARATAERLKAISGADADLPLKQAEALSYLGDDAGILAVVDAAKPSGRLKDAAGSPLFYHLAAVATARLGDEGTARRYWQAALKLQPGFDLAVENLADQRKPVGEREGPWAFTLAYWIRPPLLQELLASTKRQSDEAIVRATGHFLARHPEVGALVPLLLDHGDPRCRTLALHLAQMSGDAALLAAVRDFALGTRGSDTTRSEAARIAREAGLLPAGLTRMWLRGAWTDSMLLNFEITPEPTAVSPEAAEPWASDGIAALRAGEHARAAELLERARAAVPDSPSILNNLTLAYMQLGRQAEGEALATELFARFPDYFFARIAQARKALLARDADGAQALLDPLLARTHLHITEATALFSTLAEVQLARGEPDGADTWLNMLERVAPDDSALPHLRLRVSLTRLAQGGPLRRRKRTAAR